VIKSLSLIARSSPEMLSTIARSQVLPVPCTAAVGGRKRDAAVSGRQRRRASWSMPNAPRLAHAAPGRPAADPRAGARIRVGRRADSGTWTGGFPAHLHNCLASAPVPFQLSLPLETADPHQRLPLPGLRVAARSTPLDPHPPLARSLEEPEQELAGAGCPHVPKVSSHVTLQFQFPPVSIPSPRQKQPGGAAGRWWGCSLASHCCTTIKQKLRAPSPIARASAHWRRRRLS
jgi:hypothetical protein